MPNYRYTVIDGAGKRFSGVMEAANAAALAEHFDDRRHLLVRADEVDRSNWLFAVLNAEIRFSRGLPRPVLAQITRELAVMLEAGQDIDRALRFLVETSTGKPARTVTQALRDQVRGGKSLAASLAEQPAVFSRLYVSLVRAGEAGGQLAASLNRLAELLEREAKLAASIQSALIYPVLLVVASLATIFLLLTYVLPKFTPIFAQAGAQLPVQTRILIAIGDFVRDNGTLLLAGGLASGLIFFRLLKQRSFRLAVERVVFRLPLVGPLIIRSEAARLTRTLGTLLQNGVNLVPALGISRGVLGSVTACAIIDDALARVKSGGRLASALSDGGLFPLQTVHLLQLGEETGRLGEMCTRAADIHDGQVQETVQRLVALLVPAITIVMGLVVAGIVGSLLVAMLSLNDLAT
jgi:general secretion pathway protein F